MIYDVQCILSDAQAITADAASANIIDWGAIGTPMHAAAPLDVDWGVPDCLFVQGLITATFATLTSLEIQIQTDNDEAFGSATTIYKTEAMPAADLVQGRWIASFRLPRKIKERYMRANYNVGGSNATAGAITLGVVAGEQTAMLDVA
ncbi:MAG: Bbp16 family capsid cement protein [Pseudomonadota bacterium]